MKFRVTKHTNNSRNIFYDFPQISSKIELGMLKIEARSKNISNHLIDMKRTAQHFQLRIDVGFAYLIT